MPAETSQVSTPALTCLSRSAGGGAWGAAFSKPNPQEERDEPTQHTHSSDNGAGSA